MSDYQTTNKVCDAMHWFLVCSEEKDGLFYEGRLKFLPNGQPHYEGNMTPEDFMRIFIAENSYSRIYNQGYAAALKDAE